MKRLLTALVLAAGLVGATPETVNDGMLLVATGQQVAKNARALIFFGRPSDLALAPSMTLLAVKNSHGIVFIDTKKWTIEQELPLPKLGIDFADQLGGNGPAGILWNDDGNEVWSTDSFGWVHGARRGANGKFYWVDRIPLPAPNGKLIFEGDPNAPGSDDSAPVGLALSADGKIMFVALSRNNTVAALDVPTHHILYQIPVGNAPFGIVRIRTRLYVTNWGGRPPSRSDAAADSSGTHIRIDPLTGAANSGSISIIDPRSRHSVAQLSVGVHPCALVATRDGSSVLVANAGSDSISEIDTRTLRVVRTIPLGAGERFGRTPTALALSYNERTLYVAEGGANDVAMVDLQTARVAERFATAWYPAGLAMGDSALYVSDLKGLGSRATEFGLTLPPATIAQRNGSQRAFNVYDYAGVVERIPLSRVRTRVDEFPAASATDASGLPHFFKHVVYIIAENHTYDDYFGDVLEGNGDPKLCVFCGAVTPNHHALAKRFGLFDNFFVNATLSADGHNWTDEGYASDYLERGMSGWGRSYPSAGNDALAYSPQGFIWDRVLASHLAFRDYGEFIPDVSAYDPPRSSWRDFYNDYKNGSHLVGWKMHVDIASLRPHVNPSYPSFALRIPDQYRASVFLKDLRAFDKSGVMPSLMMLSLPNDHTAGTSPDRPTPRAYAADHDLALGRIVDGLSHSRFWRSTVIFVVEDDAQDGLDHVDGHRTMALVISAHNRRARTYSEFYNQTSILRSIEIILGLKPMTRFDARARPILEPFGEKVDQQPYDAVRNLIPLDELNPAAAASVLPDFEHHDRAGNGMAQIIRRALRR